MLEDAVPQRLRLDPLGVQTLHVKHRAAQNRHKDKIDRTDGTHVEANLPHTGIARG